MFKRSQMVKIANKDFMMADVQDLVEMLALPEYQEGSEIDASKAAMIVSVIPCPKSYQPDVDEDLVLYVLAQEGKQFLCYPEALELMPVAEDIDYLRWVYKQFAKNPEEVANYFKHAVGLNAPVIE